MNIIVGVVIVIFILICIGIYFYTQSTQDGTYRYKTQRGNFYVTLKGKSFQLIERDTRGPFIYTQVEGGMKQIIPDRSIIKGDFVSTGTQFPLKGIHASRRRALLSYLKFIVDKNDKINITVITSVDNVVQANYTLDKISDKILKGIEDPTETKSPLKAEADSVK